MKFEIYRTSDCCREKVPCEGARLVRAGSMTNSAVYEIEINTLEDLLKLIDKVGEVIIRDLSLENGHTHEIEIYDGYRE